MTSRTLAWKVALIGSILFLGNLGPAGALIGLFEGFDSVTFPPTGWIVRNQSTTTGTNAQCWNRFTTPPWATHTGTGQAGADFNCAAGANTISGWLISQQLVTRNNDQFIFWTRTTSLNTFPDRLQVRLCLDTTPDSCGAADSTGADSSSVGDFTTLLLDINPTLVTDVFPTTYTRFEVTISGLPPGLNLGRVAFRYFVTNGGPDGSNADFITIDDVLVTPVELMTFEVE